jgi:hypothetical protein
VALGFKGALTNRGGTFTSADRDRCPGSTIPTCTLRWWSRPTDLGLRDKVVVATGTSEGIGKAKLALRVKARVW